MSGEVQAESRSKPAPPIEIEAERHYHVIKIHEKRYEHEQEVVHVVANDSNVRMRRGELIPVTEDVLEALRDAKYPRYQMPTDEEMLQGKKEKKVGEINRFGFDVVFRDIPKEAYQKLRKRAIDPAAKPIIEREVEELLRRKN